MVTEAMRPVIGILQHHKGIPPKFWHDDYTLGFMGGLIGWHLQFTSGESLSSSDKGLALAEVFQNVSNLNGGELMRRFTALAAKDVGDFKLGGDRASLVFLYQLGKLKDENSHDDIVVAKKSALDLGMKDDKEFIFSLLMKKYLIDRLY